MCNLPFFLKTLCLRQKIIDFLKQYIKSFNNNKENLNSWRLEKKERIKSVYLYVKESITISFFYSAFNL